MKKYLIEVTVDEDRLKQVRDDNECFDETTMESIIGEMSWVVSSGIFLQSVKEVNEITVLADKLGTFLCNEDDEREAIAEYLLKLPDEEKGSSADGHQFRHNTGDIYEIGICDGCDNSMTLKELASLIGL